MIKDSKFFEFFSDEDMRKLYTSRITEVLLKKIRSKLERFRADPSTNSGLKYVGFSAHEHTLAALLISLQKFSSENYICGLENMQSSKAHRSRRKEVKCFEFPKYSSSLMFELHFDSEETEFYVKTLFNGKPIDFCSWNGSEYCRIDRFEQFLMKKLVADDISMVCGNGVSVLE